MFAAHARRRGVTPLTALGLVVALLLPAIALTAPSPAHAADCDWEWTGAVSSQWSDVANWNGPTLMLPPGVPGQTDGVVCIEDETNLPILHTGDEPSIAGLVSTLDADVAALRITGGSLTLAGPAELDHLRVEVADEGRLILDADGLEMPIVWVGAPDDPGGTLTVNQPATIGRLQLAGTVDGDASLTVTGGHGVGPIQWFSGTVRGAVTAKLRIQGDLETGSAAAPGVRVLESGRRLHVEGQVVHGYGSTTIEFGGHLLAGSYDLDKPGSYDHAGGELRLDGDISIHDGNYTSSDGARLVGSGQIHGDVVIGAVVAPGDGVSDLRFTDEYRQTEDGTYQVDVAGTDPEPADLLRVQRGAHLAGTLDVSLHEGFEPSIGDEFRIFVADEVTGMFDTLDLPDLTNARFVIDVRNPWGVDEVWLVVEAASSTGGTWTNHEGSDGSTDGDDDAVDAAPVTGLLAACDDLDPAGQGGHGTVHAAAVGCLDALGLLVDGPDGALHPAERVTRGQVVSSLGRLVGLLSAEETGGACGDGDAAFPDGGAVHGHAAACLARLGILSGYRDGTLRPEETVPRAQAATLLRRLVDHLDHHVPDGPPNPFHDVGPDAAHAAAISSMAAIGVVTGYGDGRFGPHDPLTHGQWSALVVRTLHHLADLETSAG